MKKNARETAAAEKKKKSRRVTTVILILIFVAGLSLVLYPTISNYWNVSHSARAISKYVEATNGMSQEEHDAILQAAADYNADLSHHGIGAALNEEQRERYLQTLNFDESGIMGYVEIPPIDVSLPIYHGIDESTLQTAVGHLEWTGLPVGGESTHCALSGHRGLPSAKLFTDLDKLHEGDHFLLMVLDEVLTYEIDQVRTVLPSEIHDLAVEEGKDFCTLITCTPYGINTHRLLVRGHRVETEADTNIHVVSEAVRIDTLLVAAVVSILPLSLLLLGLIFINPKKHRPKGFYYKDGEFYEKK